MSAPAATPNDRSRALLWIWSAAIFALAVSLRLNAAHRELPYLYDWDEPGFSDVSFRMVETGDLNPHRFNYPTLSTYAYALTDAAYLALGGHEGAATPGSAAWNASARDEWNIPQTHLALLHRQVTAWMGGATCVLTLLLAARLGLTWAAPAAALLVAISPHLIESSSHAAVGPWTALFALASLLPLARPKPGRRALIASAMAAGMAAACKYNAVLVLLPALWWAGSRGPRRASHVAGLAAIAFVTFALCSPFVLLDAGTAAHDIGYEIVHYGIRGHGPFGEGRGVGNLLFYLRTIGTALGPLAWLALPGAIGLALRDAPARRLLLFPAAYVLFMALQRTAFGRNMEPVVPLAAIYALATLEWGPDVVPAVLSRPTKGLCALLALAGLIATTNELGHARERWRMRDSRSEAMRQAAELRPGATGAAAGGLHVHGEDLMRPGGTWAVASVESTLSLARSDSLGWVLLPTAADSAAAQAIGKRFVARARFGSQPIAETGPPRQPAVTLWVRGGIR